MKYPPLAGRGFPRRQTELPGPNEGVFGSIWWELSQNLSLRPWEEFKAVAQVSSWGYVPGDDTAIQILTSPDPAASFFLSFCPSIQASVYTVIRAGPPAWGEGGGETVRFSAGWSQGRQPDFIPLRAAWTPKRGHP